MARGFQIVFTSEPDALFDSCHCEEWVVVADLMR